MGYEISGKWRGPLLLTIKCMNPVCRRIKIQIQVDVDFATFDGRLATFLDSNEGVYLDDLDNTSTKLSVAFDELEGTDIPELFNAFVTLCREWAKL